MCTTVWCVAGVVDVCTNLQGSGCLQLGDVAAAEAGMLYTLQATIACILLITDLMSLFYALFAVRAAAMWQM